MKTALVTGAGKGIGRALARFFLEQGYRTIVLSRTESDLAELQTFGNACPFVVDLADPADIIRFYNQCASQNLIPDVLVNNAGIYLPDEVHTGSSTLDISLAVNLQQVRQLSALFWEGLTQKENAYVFNIVSVLGKEIRPDAASYTISKHALSAYNKLLFAEGRKVGVKVTGIFPASVYTSSWEGTGIDKDKLIAPEDITKLVAACLTLSAAAVPDEIHIKCMTEGF